MVIVSNDDHDPEHVPPGTRTPTRTGRTTRGIPKKVACGVDTTFWFDEERILTGTLSGYAAYSEGASSNEEASGSEKVFGSEEASTFEEASTSHGATTPPSLVHSASSNEADNADSTLAPPTDVPTPVVDHPNWWCVKGQYQV